MDSQSLSHTRWKCQYHIVFIPKYRKQVLYGQVREDIREIIRTLCKYKDAEIIFIGVGTPEKRDGSANLNYVYAVAMQIAETAERECVVVVKSTVPIGTNERIEKIIKEQKIVQFIPDIICRREEGGLSEQQWENNRKEIQFRRTFITKL